MRKLLAPFVALGLAAATPVEAAQCFGERAPLNSDVSVPNGDLGFHDSLGGTEALVFFPEAHTYRAELTAEKIEFNRNLFSNMSHLVSNYDLDNLGFEADTGLLPAITRAIRNGEYS